MYILIPLWSQWFGTPAASLTTWEYQDTQLDTNNGGFGGECKNDMILTLPVH
jgi:hypothetical protein